MNNTYQVSKFCSIIFTSAPLSSGLFSTVVLNNYVANQSYEYCNIIGQSFTYPTSVSLYRNIGSSVDHVHFSTTLSLLRAKFIFNIISSNEFYFCRSGLFIICFVIQLKIQAYWTKMDFLSSLFNMCLK